MNIGAIARFTQEGDEYDGLRVRVLAVKGVHNDIEVEILTGPLAGTIEWWDCSCFEEISALEQLAEGAE